MNDSVTVVFNSTSQISLVPLPNYLILDIYLLLGNMRGLVFSPRKFSVSPRLDLLSFLALGQKLLPVEPGQAHLGRRQTALQRSGIERAQITEAKIPPSLTQPATCLQC